MFRYYLRQAIHVILLIVELKKTMIDTSESGVVEIEEMEYSVNSSQDLFIV